MTPVLANRRVELALALLTGFLEMPMLPQVRENPGLLALLLETLECALEALILMDDDFRHVLHHPLQGPKA